LRFFRKMFEILTSKQKRQLCLLFTLSVIVSLTEVLGIVSIAPFMTVAANPTIIHTNSFLSELFSLGRFTSEGTFLKTLGLGVLLVLIVGNVLGFALNWSLTFFGTHIGRVISVNLFKSYLNKDYLFHTQSNTAVLVKNVFHEVLRVANNLIVQSLVLSSKLITIIFIAGGLFLLDPLLATSIGITLGACYIAIYTITKKKLLANGTEMSLQIGNSYQIANEGLGGIKDVKLSAKENSYVKLLDKILKKYERLAVYNSVMPLTPRYVLEIFIFGGSIISLLYFLDKGRTLSEFLPVISLFALAGIKLMPALQIVFSGVTTIKSNMFSFDLIVNDLTTLVSEELSYDGHHFKESLFKNFKVLNVENVSFKYSGADKNVLENVTLQIQRNTTCAFVGQSGSGKSTLVDLLSGLLLPNSGNIKVDQSTLNKENIKVWQSEISYVPQSVYLTDGNFIENIAFGEDEKTIDMELVFQSAKLARIHDFIESRQQGYESKVGERGVQISGGQRQRIGIARALYRNPSVLIFDEATSALDSITESEIMESIVSLSGKKTIILISHRMSSIKYCDQIFLLDKGRLVADGTYSDLIKKSLLFQELGKQI
jgi:ATP-binding cassette, subfamily B, bacterial PglK